MIYINYVATQSMYSSQDELETYKKVLEGDSFEITSYYLSTRSSKPLDRDGESYEYHQNAVFTIRTDAGVVEEFNIDVGHIIYQHSSYYRSLNKTKETYSYIKRFGIACKNETVLFETYKEKDGLVYANTQLTDWLNEKTNYIDSMFEKVSKVKQKKRELENDFQEDYTWHEYKK